MRWQSAWAVARKEIFHIIRDPFTLALALGMPVVMVLIFGYAIEFNLNRIPMAVFDGDRSFSSRELVRTFTNSDYFRAHKASNPALAIQGLDEGRDHAALIIHPSFEKDLQSLRGGQVQVLVDGADNSAAISILSYLGKLQTMAVKRSFSRVDFKPLLNVETRFLYNPELNSRWFVVPGLTAVIVAVLSILLTSLTVAREWENGSMELLLATPVKPIEIIVGKLLPYSIMGLIAIFFVFTMSQLIFDIPFRGNFILYFVTCLIFLVTYLAQGLLISVLTRKQQISMQFAMLSGLLPTVLLSGFIFPNEHMPAFFYYFTMILPARWFIRISREIFLQGAGFIDILPSFFALCVLFCLMIFLALKKFKTDVEP
jgi:ABC-2 type transport system permease protein